MVLVRDQEHSQWLVVTSSTPNISKSYSRYIGFCTAIEIPDSVFLQLILLVGNYMNGTGIKGGAFGFRVSSVNKVDQPYSLFDCNK